MKKIALILLSAVTALCFASCASNVNTNDSGNKKTADISVTPAEIEQKIADAVGKDNYLCDSDIQSDYLQNTIGLDLSEIESYAAKQNSISSVNPDTVIILKVKNGYEDKAVEVLNESYARMVEYIRQYPFGTAKVLNARIYQNGCYIMYIIAGAGYDGEDSEAENKLAADEYDKIDEAVKSVFGALPENSAVVPDDDGSTGGLISSYDNDGDLPMLGGN